MRPSLIITAVENGWIVTMDESLFVHAMHSEKPRPIWVFNTLGGLTRFIKAEGFKLARRTTIPRPTATLQPATPVGGHNS